MLRKIGILNNLHVEPNMTDMTNEFTANYMFSKNDGDVVTVGFADQQYQTKDYVLLQRTLNPSQGDKARKWDHIHITVSDESRSAYGGIEGLELWPDHVLIILTPATAAQVQSVTMLRVGLTADVKHLIELREMLKVLCDDYVKVNLHI